MEGEVWDSEHLKTDWIFDIKGTLYLYINVIIFYYGSIMVLQIF